GPRLDRGAHGVRHRHLPHVRRAAQSRRAEAAQDAERALPHQLPRRAGRARVVRRLGEGSRSRARDPVRLRRRARGAAMSTLVRGSATAVDLKVTIGGLTLQGPVLAASGTYGYGDEFGERFDLARLG